MRFIPHVLLLYRTALHSRALVLYCTELNCTTTIHSWSVRLHCFRDGIFTIIMGSKAPQNPITQWHTYRNLKSPRSVEPNGLTVNSCIRSCPSNFDPTPSIISCRSTSHLPHFDNFPPPNRHIVVHVLLQLQQQYTARCHLKFLSSIAWVPPARWTTACRVACPSISG